GRTSPRATRRPQRRSRRRPRPPSRPLRCTRATAPVPPDAGTDTASAGRRAGRRLSTPPPGSPRGAPHRRSWRVSASQAARLDHALQELLRPFFLRRREDLVGRSLVEAAAAGEAAAAIGV